jgi:hypothetical protein
MIKGFFQVRGEAGRVVDHAELRPGLPGLPAMEVKPDGSWGDFLRQLGGDGDYPPQDKINYVESWDVDPGDVLFFRHDGDGISRPYRAVALLTEGVDDLPLLADWAAAQGVKWGDFRTICADYAEELDGSKIEWCGGAKYLAEDYEDDEGDDDEDDADIDDDGEE